MKIEGKDLRILLVEDDKLNQLYFGEIISELNINYQVCEGYSDAIALINKYNYSLIISDAILKDGNGIELINVSAMNVKQQKSHIIISGHTKEKLKENYGNFSCDAFLMKPINQNSLKTAIINCLKLNSSINESKIPYDFNRIAEILENDKYKIEQSVKDYNEKLYNAIILMEELINNKEFNRMKEAFHDIINLSQYFGAEVLSDLLVKHREEKISTKKNEYLNEIKIELNLVYNFYKDFIYIEAAHRSASKPVI